mgnify:CR=1 FL=1
MKKLVLALVALLVTIGMVTPVVADDKVSISGEYRVFYYNLENYDWNTTDDDSVVDYFHQRLRVATKIAVADGVSINVRNDFTESTWGAAGQNTARFENNADIQFDKAYLEIAKDAYTLRLGQQYYRQGMGIVVDHLGTGAYVGLKSVPLTLIYTQLNEYGTNEKAGSDTDSYLVGAQFDIKPIGGSVFVSNLNDGAAGSNNTGVAGISMNQDLGAIKLKAELDYFFGDNGLSGAAKVDNVGTQLYVDASTKLADNFTLGAIALYAMDAADADETQQTRLTKFADWEPHTYGPFTTEFDALGGNDIWEACGADAGIMGLEVYGTMNASADLDVLFSLAYLQPVEDSLTKLPTLRADDVMMANLSALYNFAPNTKVGAQLNYGTASAPIGPDPEDAIGLMAGIWTKF